MPRQTIDQKRALILSRLLLDYVGVLERSIRKHRRSAEAAADTLLMSAIYVGQSEGHPMTAHKLAQYSRIPRPTVVRKLRELQAMGYVTMDDDGHASICQETLSGARFAETIRDLNALVRKASTELSKLDS